MKAPTHRSGEGKKSVLTDPGSELCLGREKERETCQDKETGEHNIRMSNSTHILCP